MNSREKYPGQEIMDKPNEPHRKRIKHYDSVGHVRELTFSCYKRLPLLTDEARCDLLATAIDRANQRHGYGLAAYVFMPEHVHLLVFPHEGASNISDLLWAIKRPTSYRIKQQLDPESSLFSQLTVRQRPGVSTFRFWQEGPGYDRNLTERDATLAAINYIHMNPVRRQLVEQAIDWRWSSARYYVDSSNLQAEQAPSITPLPPHWFD